MARSPALDGQSYRLAVLRGENQAKLPTAVTSTKVDSKRRTLVLHFRNGASLLLPLSAIEELAGLHIARLKDVRPSPLGDGLIFDAAGVAIHVPGLLRDLFGSAFQGALGKRGGAARTRAKITASRKNGRKGGRPRKVA